MSSRKYHSFSARSSHKENVRFLVSLLASARRTVSNRLIGETLAFGETRRVPAADPDKSTSAANLGFSLDGKRALSGGSRPSAS
jgi:hypothetical protein